MIPNELINALSQAIGFVDPGVVVRVASGDDVDGSPDSWEVDVDTDADRMRPFGRVSVRYTPRITRADEPYAFFATRSDAPWFQKLVFASPDETVTGRCTTFEGDTWYPSTPDLATIVDDRLAPEGLARVIGALLSSMRSQLAIESVIDSINLAAPTNDETALAMHDTMRAIAMNRASQFAQNEFARAHANRVVCMFPPRPPPDDSMTTADVGAAIPSTRTPSASNLRDLFVSVNAPGPVVAYPPPDHQTDWPAVTVQGGNVAIVAVGDPVSRRILDDASAMFDASVTGTMHTEIRGARVIVFVDATASDSLLKTTFRHAHDPGSSSRIFVGGVPVTSIASFSTVLYTYARDCETSDPRNFTGFGAGPLGCVSLDAATERKRRDRAELTLSAAVSRSLPKLRARLWRPDGRLVGDMIRTWS